MRRFRSARLLSLLPLLLTAACIDEGGAGPAPLPTEQIQASFPVHGIANAILVEATERLPLRVAELIAPDGTKTYASVVDLSPSLPSGGTQPTAFPSLGNMSELMLPGPVAAGADRSASRLSITVSKASIPLPDPVAYRRDWRKYKIRLEFGRPPGPIEAHLIDAPAPPAPQR